MNFLIKKFRSIFFKKSKKWIFKKSSQIWFIN